MLSGRITLIVTEELLYGRSGNVKLVGDKAKLSYSDTELGEMSVIT